jgi:hypothetical protein
LGLNIGYYFGAVFGTWRYIYGNRDPKEIFNQCQSERFIKKVGLISPDILSEIKTAVKTVIDAVTRLPPDPGFG